MALSNSFQLSEADVEFRRAIELNPNYSSAHYFYAICSLSPENHLDQAIDEMRTALSLDPLSSIVNTNWLRWFSACRALCRIGGAISKGARARSHFLPAYFKMSKLYANMGSRFPGRGEDSSQVFFHQAH